MVRALRCLRRCCGFKSRHPRCGSIAQLIEQRPFKAMVAGLNPAAPTYGEERIMVNSSVFQAENTGSIPVSASFLAEWPSGRRRC
jgi:hypothetical protein